MAETVDLGKIENAVVHMLAYYISLTLPQYPPPAFEKPQ